MAMSPSSARLSRSAELMISILLGGRVVAPAARLLVCDDRLVQAKCHLGEAPEGDGTASRMPGRAASVAAGRCAGARDRAHGGRAPARGHGVAGAARDHPRRSLFPQ